MHQQFPKRNVSSSSITFPSWFVTLSNSTPVSYAQQFVISFHEITGTPWWATIMLSAVTLRLVITLPLAAYQVGKILFLIFDDIVEINLFKNRIIISNIQLYNNICY